MNVLAKFILGGVTPCVGYYNGETVDGCTVNLRAAQGEPFGPATPSGGISMTIFNPSAAKVFLDAGPEAEFYVSFERVGQAIAESSSNA